MLLPFLLFELPIAWLADARFGEKEFMVAGFIILAIATFSIPLAAGFSMLGWALLLFASRTGAALVEASSETHFFTRVSAADAGVIGLFRMTRPLSFVFGPLLGILLLPLFGLGNIFFGFGALLLLGIPLSLSTIDTR